jgi:hypothetical protein
MSGDYGEPRHQCPSQFDAYLNLGIHRLGDLRHRARGAVVSEIRATVDQQDMDGDLESPESQRRARQSRLERAERRAAQLSLDSRTRSHLALP